MPKGITITFIPLKESFLEERSFYSFEGPFILGRLGDQDSVKTPGSVQFDSKVVSRKHALISIDDYLKIYIKDTKSSSGTFLNGKRLSPQGKESDPVELKSGDVVQMGEDCEVNGVFHKSVIFKVQFSVPTPLSAQPPRSPLIQSEDFNRLSARKTDSFHSGIVPHMLNYKHSSSNAQSAAASSPYQSTSSLLDPNAYQDGNTNSLSDHKTDSMSNLLGDLETKIEIENEFNAIWETISTGSNSNRKYKYLARILAGDLLSSEVLRRTYSKMNSNASMSDVSVIGGRESGLYSDEGSMHSGMDQRNSGRIANNGSGFHSSGVLNGLKARPNAVNQPISHSGSVRSATRQKMA